MKNILILIISFMYASIWSQEVESLYDGPSYAESNKYYKDLYNDLDPFVGTWLLTNGNTSLTITLQKKIRMATDDFFEDVLVGGYKYIVNGTTIVNTLPLLENNFTEQENYTLFGNTLIGPSSSSCNNCNESTRIVLLQFWEPDRDVWDMAPEMQFRRVDEGSVQKVKVVFKPTSTGIPNSLDHDPEFETQSIPFGTYVLTKQ